MSETEGTQDGTTLQVVEEQAEEVEIHVPKSLQRRLNEFADNIYQFARELQEKKETIKQQFDKIIEEGRKLDITDSQLGKLLKDTLQRKGVSESYIRKIMPKSLKDQTHTNYRYLQSQQVQQLPEQIQVPVNQEVQQIEITPAESIIEVQPPDLKEAYDKAIEQIKELSHVNLMQSKQLERQLLTIEDLKAQVRDSKHLLREESFIGKAFLALGDNEIPIKVTVNVKSRMIEFVEIDSETVKSALMRQ